MRWVNSESNAPIPCPVLVTNSTVSGDNPGAGRRGHHVGITADNGRGRHLARGCEADTAGSETMLEPPHVDEFVCVHMCLSY